MPFLASSHNRRQKRWWNAYLLFYERVDVLSQTKRPGDVVHMPDGIRWSVQKENINFLHTRTQFSTEYFQFIRKLTLACVANTPQQQQNQQQNQQQQVAKVCERETLTKQLICATVFSQLTLIKDKLVYFSLFSYSRGRIRLSRTITLTIYELVAPGRPLGALPY